ncbi:CapA family protein [Patescibacteria group bacterium]|nr:CapA family protein [Patescibacteria group bacterium]
MKEKILIFGLVALAIVVNAVLFFDGFYSGDVKTAALELDIVPDLIDIKVGNVFGEKGELIFPMNKSFHYSRNLEILAFGDAMLDRGVRQYMDKNGVDYPFEKISEDIANIANENTITFLNLEGPVLDRPRVLSGGLYFSFKPDAVDALKRAGFNIVNLANNHTFNQKEQGFEDTKRILSEKGINYFGVPIKSVEKDVHIEDFGGGTVAFIGYDDVLSPIETENAKILIQKMAEENDYVIVSVHWGQEYKTVQNNHQEELGHMFVDAGADAVIGHHPHVVQPMEIYNGKPIFYSLGNFIFDQYFSKETQQGLAVHLVFEKNYFTDNEDGGFSIEFHPFNIPRSQPDFMEGDEKDAFLKKYGMD